VRGLREELKTAAREVRRETRAQTRRDARRPDSVANGTAYARLAREVASLTRDSLAAARDADEAAVLAAVEALQRAHSEVLALLGEHT
jgi:hypothetical protein